MLLGNGILVPDGSAIALNQIRMAVFEEELHPGDKLPSEKALLDF
jgi:DNA-binding FadR family transcriptional regulator